MSKEDTVSIQLPESLVRKAEDEGLNVSKTCELALERRLEALGEIDSNGANPSNSNSYNGNNNHVNGNNGNHSNHNHKVSFSKTDVQNFCNRLSAAGRSSLRVNAVKGKLEKLGAHVNWSCNLNDVTDYLNGRRKEVSNRTLSDDIQAIKQFFKDMNVYWIEKIKKPNLSKHRPKVVEKEDILNLMNELDHDKTEDKYVYRAQAAVHLSAVTGMRPWEIYRLSWEDVDIEERIIDLPAEKTKTKEERIVVFNERAQKRLRKLKKLFPDRPFINKAIYLITNKMDEKPELKLKHCRKFFSQEWDRRNGSTRIKEMLLGHFGSIDLRNYNGQTPDHLKDIYDEVGIKVLD
ncbi:hypothetical protein AKJ58_00325 [candidate division MSBL1 archaeon SCGC-AAA385D11]|uniref:Tyr recombinase domain-containing protein n=1 Tax=candidate division MSBL1 archaeon SCGC-AAA385D11 TaxID=1698286 RepID=A0A133VPA0_9EURY|nr:hypothetical protein AKJ58_00325 [candidate division MSBL1 archaeon SCGC-AAA385D11]